MHAHAHFHISEGAEKQLSSICSKPENKGRFLRIIVQGGGCAGFQHHFILDNTPHAEDIKIGKHLAMDPSSLDLLKGATLEYHESLGESQFELKIPKATSHCGCGSSFSV